MFTQYTFPFRRFSVLPHRAPIFCPRNTLLSPRPGSNVRRIHQSTKPSFELRPRGLSRQCPMGLPLRERVARQPGALLLMPPRCPICLRDFVSQVPPWPSVPFAVNWPASWPLPSCYGAYSATFHWPLGLLRLARIVRLL